MQGNKSVVLNNGGGASGHVSQGFSSGEYGGQPSGGRGLLPDPVYNHLHAPGGHIQNQRDHVHAPGGHFQNQRDQVPQNYHQGPRQQQQKMLNRDVYDEDDGAYGSGFGHRGRSEGYGQERGALLNHQAVSVGHSGQYHHSGGKQQPHGTHADTYPRQDTYRQTQQGAPPSGGYRQRAPAPSGGGEGHQQFSAAQRGPQRGPSTVIQNPPRGGDWETDSNSSHKHFSRYPNNRRMESLPGDMKYGLLSRMLTQLNCGGYPFVKELPVTFLVVVSHVLDEHFFWGTIQDMFVSRNRL